MPDTIRKNNVFFRQLLFLAVLILMGAVMFKQLAFFIGSFLGAITFYVVFRGLLFRMTEKHRWKPWLASLVIVMGICAVLLGLGFLIFEILAKEIQNLDASSLLSSVQALVPTVNKLVGFQLVSPNFIHESSELLGKVANTILNTTYSFASNIFMTIIIIYFMLTHARKLEDKGSKYLPFRGDSRKQLTEEITSIIYSNAVGIPLMMLCQGIVAALIYWLFGMDNIVFWAFLTALCGLIPMVGTIIVSVPLGVYFMADGFVLKGILLMLCGVLVIANVDNVARIILNQRITNTHPLIIIFGVILGIPLFGFWGIIFGPLMISVFLLLIRIYYKEYKLLEPDTSPTGLPSVAEKVEEETEAEKQ